MDGFMDKLSQKLNAQEMIRANADAEAKELSELRDQVQAYEDCFSRMQETEEVNSANAAQVKELLNLYQEKLDAVQNLSIDIPKPEPIDLSPIEEALKNMKVDTASLEELLNNMKDQIEEFSHKENVKVYRNVQAAITEQVENQTNAINTNLMSALKQEEQLKEQIAKLDDRFDDLELLISKKGGSKKLVVLQVLTLLVAIANVVIFFLCVMGIM